LTSKHRDLVTLEGAPFARRQFLGAAGRAGLLALVAPALAIEGATEAYGATERSYFGGSYGLLLDGAFAGYLTGFSGGNIVGEVVKVQPVGADRIQRKHLGNSHTEPLTIECGFPMSKSLLDWIKSSIEPGAKAPLKNGAIVEFDGTRKEMGRRNFFNAAITEVEFPSCDASSKDAARLTVTFQPEAVTLAAGSGGTPGQVAAGRWLRSNFSLKIQGLEQALTRTSAIDAVVVKLKGADGGDVREPSRVPSAIDAANLNITVADTMIGQIYQWHQEFVIKRTGKPRPGILDYLTPDMKSVILSLNFSNLGIIKVAPEALAAGTTSAVRRSRVEMYCEGVTINSKI